MYSRNLFVLDFVRRFFVSCAQISEALALRPPLKFGCDWRKIGHKGRYRKDSERTLITACFLFVPRLMFLQYCATACTKYNKFALYFQVYFIYFLGFLSFAQFIMLHFVHIFKCLIILNGSAYISQYIHGYCSCVA